MTATLLRTTMLVGLFFCVVSPVARAQRPPTPVLPDWSGVWQMVGPTVFDTSTVEPPNGRAGEPGVRERPPYNDEWEARYRKNIEGIRNGVFPDPRSEEHT